MRNVDYFRSERFIHDDLARLVKGFVEQVRATWRVTQAVEDYAITWPGADIKADDGSNIDRMVLCKLPPATRDARMKTLREMVARTKAYGIAVIERVDACVMVWFETKHGARAWRIPLERHGDVTVCGAPAMTEDGPALHLLWRARD